MYFVLLQAQSLLFLIRCLLSPKVIDFALLLTQKRATRAEEEATGLHAATPQRHQRNK